MYGTSIRVYKPRFNLNPIIRREVVVEVPNPFQPALVPRIKSKGYWTLNRIPQFPQRWIPPIERIVRGIGFNGGWYWFGGEEGKKNSNCRQGNMRYPRRHHTPPREGKRDPSRSKGKSYGAGDDVPRWHTVDRAATPPPPSFRPPSGLPLEKLSDRCQCYRPNSFPRRWLNAKFWPKRKIYGHPGKTYQRRLRTLLSKPGHTVSDLNPTYNANQTEIARGGLKLFFSIPGVKIKLYTGLSDKAWAIEELCAV